MRIREIRKGDLPGVESVYGARAGASVGLLVRPRMRWTKMRQSRVHRGLWFVAEDRGKIVGYSLGSYFRGNVYHLEVMWHPDYDGTSLGEELLERLINRVERMKPFMPGSEEMIGSPANDLYESAGFTRVATAVVFLAAVTDRRLLLRDAGRIINRRIDGKIRLNVDGKSISVGKKDSKSVTISMDSGTLLGLLLGLRRLSHELRRRNVRYSPKVRESLTVLKSAFPERQFWIKDGW